MNFEDLKENLKAQWDQLLGRIQESPAFTSLKDRFEALPTQTQKIIQVFGVIFIIMIFMWIPYSTYLVSQENIESFESKRNLVRELLRVSKEASENSLNIFPPSESEARSRIETAINSAGILPEQKAGINTVPLMGNLIKGSVVESVLEAKLIQLNLTQALNLGLSLARIQGTKLKDLQMDAHPKDPRYLDVSYKLVIFKSFGSGPAGASDEVGPPPPPPPGGRGGAGRPNGNRGDN